MRSHFTTDGFNYDIPGYEETRERLLGEAAAAWRSEARDAIAGIDPQRHSASQAAAVLNRYASAFHFDARERGFLRDLQGQQRPLSIKQQTWVWDIVAKVVRQ